MSCISIVDTLFVRTGLLLCAACKARAFLLVGEEEEEEEEAATPPSTGARSLVAWLPIDSSGRALVLLDRAPSLSLVLRDKGAAMVN